MTSIIDKLAFIYLQDHKVLVTMSRAKNSWYIPGGKRERGESDHQALIREVKEELTVDIIPHTIKPYGIFEAQAHGKPKGTIVRMTCYTADFKGILTPSQEIEALDFFSYSQIHHTAPVDHLIFEDLHSKKLLQ